MDYLQQIRAAHNDPEALETLYQAARRGKEESAFVSSLLACREQAPENILYAAWACRLQQAVEEQADRRSIHWKLAIPLSVALGLICWGLSDPHLDLPAQTPYLLLAWAPISACFIIAFLALTSGERRGRAGGIVAALLGATLYVTLWVALRERLGYQKLMLVHLPFLAWFGVGASILGFRSDDENRFAALIKSIEVLVTAGIFAIAGGAFGVITFGMFGVLGVEIPESIMRLIAAGGAGLIPVIAVASAYDPHAAPARQRFDQGLSKLVATLMRLLLPLTLIVLAIYLVAIPFNFMEPFRNRDALIVYNVMLFGIMGLLAGATPVSAQGLAPKTQAALRRGILAAAILGLLVSLYALAAIVYRTVWDQPSLLAGVTINRLAVIGWNSINIGILVALIVQQFRQGQAGWVSSLHSVFSRGLIGYVVWTAFLILAIPLLFTY